MIASVSVAKLKTRSLTTYNDLTLLQFAHFECVETY